MINETTWGIYYLILFAVSFAGCLGWALKLIRGNKQGRAVMVMLLGPFGIASLIWVVTLIVVLCMYGI